MNNLITIIFCKMTGVGHNFAWKIQTSAESWLRVANLSKKKKILLLVHLAVWFLEHFTWLPPSSGLNQEAVRRSNAPRVHKPYHEWETIKGEVCSCISAENKEETSKDDKFRSVVLFLNRFFSLIKKGADPRSVHSSGSLIHSWVIGVFTSSVVKACEAALIFFFFGLKWIRLMSAERFHVIERGS